MIERPFKPGEYMRQLRAERARDAKEAAEREAKRLAYIEAYWAAQPPPVVSSATRKGDERPIWCEKCGGPIVAGNYYMHRFIERYRRSECAHFWCGHGDPTWAITPGRRAVVR